MEAKLKSIEEKLDILIAAMSVNPEFEKYVKEGLLNIKIEKLKEEVKSKNIERSRAISKFISTTFEIYSEEYEEIFPDRIKKYAPKHNSPEYAHQLIIQFQNITDEARRNYRKAGYTEFMDKTIKEPTYCSAMYEEIIKRFGPELNIEEEIEKLKNQL